MKFEYLAKNKKGQEEEGIMEAENKNEVTEKLKEKIFLKFIEKTYQKGKYKTIAAFAEK